ncbi:hypothetical protein CDAR_380171 [Caerostris darwini]|uniref:Uncharacterized protein n=1 Tax=Caerostris darwini TaxID=1538125 RepID=A0AAV4R5E0_9ARAC|nr:hypothetical protein CDAR_380171 [Caerostris darwini]
MHILDYSALSGPLIPAQRVWPRINARDTPLTPHNLQKEEKEGGALTRENVKIITIDVKLHSWLLIMMLLLQFIFDTELFGVSYTNAFIKTQSDVECRY